MAKNNVNEEFEEEYHDKADEEITDDFDGEYSDGDIPVDKISLPKKPIKVGRQWLIIFQLAFCGAAMLFLVALKLIGGSFSDTVISWYKDSYQNSIFTNQEGKNDISIFNQNGSDSADKENKPEENSKGAKTDNDKEQKKTDNASSLKTSEVKKDDLAKSTKAFLPLENGTITSSYGERVDDITGETSFHKGLDIGADYGEAIYSLYDGTVDIAEESPSYGNYIVLLHGDGTKTLYAHCSKLCVKKGDTVKQGEKIAEVGSTGDSTGNHLHIEVIKNDKNIDPTAIIGSTYG